MSGRHRLPYPPFTPTAFRGHKTPPPSVCSAGGPHPPVGARRRPGSPSPGPRRSHGLAGAGAALRKAERGCGVSAREGLSLLPTRSVGMRCHFDGISLLEAFYGWGKSNPVKRKEENTVGIE